MMRDSLARGVVTFRGYQEPGLLGAGFIGFVKGIENGTSSGNGFLNDGPAGTSGIGSPKIARAA